LDAATISIAFVILRVFCTLLIFDRISFVLAMIYANPLRKRLSACNPQLQHAKQLRHPY
jgi:hypothetical protein